MKRLSVVVAIVGMAVILVGVAAAMIRPKSGTPEQAADMFLREIRAERFEAAFAPLRPNGVNSETEMREKQYRPLWFWWFADRREANGELRLHYKVIRGWIPIPSPVWVIVKNNSGRWRVSGFEAWY